MSLYDQLADNFFRWEQRGRGVDLFPAPVELEPPFVAFPGHRVMFENPQRDSGVQETFFSRLSGKVFRALQPPKQGALVMRVPPTENEIESMPDWFGEKEPVIEFSLLLPGGVAYSAETMGHFLTTLSLVSGIVGLEIMGTATEIILQLICQSDDAEIVVEQIEAHFPEMKFTWSQENLFSLWRDDDGLSERMVLEFGLHAEFMRPLDTSYRVDPFVSLIGGMAHLAEGEVAVYQVLFTPLHAPWAENALAAVTKQNGKPFFDDGADLVKETQAKVSRPLYGAVLRLASRAESPQRTWNILRGMVPALRHFSKDRGQSLTPLSNKDYDWEEHCDDLLWRRSRRCGMILNLDELIGLVHWPSPAVVATKFHRLSDVRTRQAPLWDDDDDDAGTLILGENHHDGVGMDVILSQPKRLQHMHCIGATGTGKSTLMLSMILQDLNFSRGFAILDPHGDLIDLVLASVPADRLKDVVLIDPSDEQFVVPFNVLSAHTDNEKTLLASDLVSVFRRLSTSWGDRMEIIFQNLVLAFLEHAEGGTLADMRKFLVDEDWRATFLLGVDDPDIQFYWTRTFPKLDGPRSVGPILTRLETFLTQKMIRYMVSQKENRIDFSEIMDRSRILLVRLPQGEIGKENAYMLGSLVMVKLQQAAMGRARMPANQRVPFYCYVDECQHFVTPSMAEILSGARKYGLGLILAHQDLQQLAGNGDVAAAVMTNTATRIVFRISEGDGRALKGDFAHYEAKDFSSLGKGEAICRIERADQDFNLRVVRPDDIDENEGAARKRAATEASRSRYSVPRKQVEAEIRAQMTADLEKSKPGKSDRTIKTEKAKSESKPIVPEAELETSQVLKESTSKSPAVLDASEAIADANETQSKPPDSPPPLVGLGRGGADHQMIVTRLTDEAIKLGYRATKEMSVADGRVDLAIESRQRRIAVEVAVSANTAHEIENLTKCLEAGFDFVVSLSPSESTTKNIERAAGRTFDELKFGKLRFFSLPLMLDWLSGFVEADAQIVTIPKEKFKVIDGRRIRVKRVEMTEAERQKMEADQLETIAEMVQKNSSKME